MLFRLFNKPPGSYIKHPFVADVLKAIRQSEAAENRILNALISGRKELEVQKKEDMERIQLRIAPSIESEIYSPEDIINDRNAIIRGMSIREIDNILRVGSIGLGPRDVSKKKTHKDIIEHLVKNNSKIYTSFTDDFALAMEYAGQHLFPGLCAVVDARFPVAIDIKAIKKLCPELWDLYDRANQRGAHDNELLGETIGGTSASLYSTQEMVCVNFFDEMGVDIRPSLDNIPKVVLLQSGGILNGIVTEPLISDIVVNSKSKIFPWQIQVVGEENTMNIIHLNAYQENRLDPSERLLCLEDAQTIFDVLVREFPEQKYLPNAPSVVLKTVPSHLEIASPALIDYALETVSSCLKEASLLAAIQEPDHSLLHKNI